MRAVFGKDAVSVQQLGAVSFRVSLAICLAAWPIVWASLSPATANHIALA
jgi:hypothetical protein